MASMGAARDDTRLVAQMARGDQSALVVLWERHAGPVHSYLRTLCADRTDAEELLQDTFVAAWRSAAAYRARAGVRSWLFAIARRRARDRSRRLQRDRAAPAELDSLPSSQPGPEELAVARAGLEEIAAQIQRLSPIHREVLVLTFAHQLSYEEISQIVEAPIGTVKSRLSNARRALTARQDATR
jgi:RNA polymerase sigma-70 factor (ECF subfamily)